MSVLDQLQESLSDFSRNERHVADYILSNPQEMRSLSGEALAAICGVSRSTVLRLCQKLGYQGYAEFKYALQHETEHPAQTRPADALPTQNVLTYYCSGMLQMEPLVTSDALRDFADTLSHANPGGGTGAKPLFCFGRATGFPVEQVRRGLPHAVGR